MLTYADVCKRVSTCACCLPSIHTYIHTYIYHTYVHIYISNYGQEINVYIHIYVHIYRHIHTYIHHQCADPGADALSSPHLRINCADLAAYSSPGRISDHVFAPSRTRISSPLAIAREQRLAIPTSNATRRVPVQLVRTTRSPAPVRGPTSPSTPPSHTG